MTTSSAQIENFLQEYELFSPGKALDNSESTLKERKNQIEYFKSVEPERIELIEQCVSNSCPAETLEKKIEILFDVGVSLRASPDYQQSGRKSSDTTFCFHSLGWDFGFILHQYLAVFNDAIDWRTIEKGGRRFAFWRQTVLAVPNYTTAVGFINPYQKFIAPINHMWKNNTPTFVDYSERLNRNLIHSFGIAFPQQ
ncbi:hypothetical protein ACT3SZ_05775 [Corynebacterium sp. AOP40-9SA-29]|uniref:hypothetical protein n=1 Tax=Corynebacterium sp. AOP40-9SA-29 TaxID=3457677 RepID=UPI00403435E9